MASIRMIRLATTAPTVNASNFEQLMQSAHCAITVDSGERPYQGIVDIEETSLAASQSSSRSR